MFLRARRGAGSGEEVLIYDNMFTTWKKYVLDFTRAKRAGGYDFIYGVNARADKLDEETVKALAESKCLQVFIGVASGSERILDFLGTRTRVEQFRKAAERCRSHGVTILANLPVGVPGETEESCRRAQELRNSVRPQVIAYNYLTPFPGTAMYTYCIENDLIDPDMPYGAYEMNASKIRGLVRGVDYDRVKRWEPRILSTATHQPALVRPA